MVKWQGRRQSTNFEDRRGAGGGFSLGRLPLGLGRGGGLGGGLGGGGLGGGGMRTGGIGGILLVVVVVVLYFVFVSPSNDTTTSDGTTTTVSDDAQAFSLTILADTEDVWNQIFSARGANYVEPSLVFYEQGTDTGCGYGDSAVGPFYCPIDQKLYLDLSFFDELAQEFNASGDFATAYIIAHEVGHHVQNLTGVLQREEQLGANANEAQVNALSVRTELQADCYAGVFAYYEENAGFLDVGDIDEALNAAAAVGDDTLQMQTQGYVVPESFNHGTSAQRSGWFRRGYASGDMNQCDTFSAQQL